MCVGDGEVGEMCLKLGGECVGGVGCGVVEEMSEVGVSGGGVDFE